MSLEEPELSQRRLLFLLSLRRERCFEGVAPLVRPILGRKTQLGEQAIAERLRQVVLELLHERLFAIERQQLTPSLTKETFGGSSAVGRGAAGVGDDRRCGRASGCLVQAELLRCGGRTRRVSA